MNEEVSKIEIAKALKSINSISTNEQIEKVINIFSNSEEDKVYFNNAINGLSEEDEFALLTKLMKTSTCIIGLEQRPIVSGDYIIPDFLVTFKPCCTINSRLSNSFNEYNCLVEVKSTVKNKFKIGGNRLKKLRNTADRYKLPLIIAVRFVGIKEHALWAFIEDDRKKTSINIDVNACIKGVRHVLWDEYSIVLNPTLTIIAEYHSDSQSKTVSHKSYGRQEKLKLVTKNKTILIEKKGIQLLYSVFLECFNLEVKAVEKINNNITLEYLQPSIPLMLLSDIVFRINRIATNEDGSICYDASKILASLDSKNTNTLLSRDYLESIFGDLLHDEIIFYGGINDTEKHLEKWKEFGKVED